MTPSEREASQGDDAEIRDAAARWVIRQDRQLPANEAADLEAWLAGDPRRASAYARSMAAWRRCRELANTARKLTSVPDSRPSYQTAWQWYAGLAAAVILGFVIFGPRLDRPDVKKVVAATSFPAERHFGDGSVALLRPGAEIRDSFSSAVRRVYLVHGEAYFKVAKDPSRPFLVTVGRVTVEAVGTAFSVRMDPEMVDVLVTEGTVRVSPPGRKRAEGNTSGPEAEPAMVPAGNRAFVPFAPGAERGPVVVSAVSTAEIARSLSWRQPMVELGGATLADLAAAFSERSGRRIEIADSALRSVHIGGRFPTDDVDGLVRVLGELYDIKSEVHQDGSVTLRR